MPSPTLHHRRPFRRASIRAASTTIHATRTNPPSPTPTTSTTHSLPPPPTIREQQRNTESLTRRLFGMQVDLTMEVQRNERLRAMLSDTVLELEEARRQGESWRGKYERAVEEVEWEGWDGGAAEEGGARARGRFREELETGSIHSQSIPPAEDTVVGSGAEGGCCRCVCVCVAQGRREERGEERRVDRWKGEKREKREKRCWRRVIRRVRVRFEHVFRSRRRRRLESTRG